jgi:predicted heme/steroid binding protein
MSPPAAVLNPPKVCTHGGRGANPQNDPISLTKLAEFNGQDASKPIYVAIKGKVFDVSAKREMYGPGAGYNIFAGKDASKGLGEYHFSTPLNRRDVFLESRRRGRRLLVTGRSPDENTRPVGGILY